MTRTPDSRFVTTYNSIAWPGLTWMLLYLIGTPWARLFAALLSLAMCGWLYCAFRATHALVSLRRLYGDPEYVPEWWGVR